MIIGGKAHRLRRRGLGATNPNVPANATGVTPWWCGNSFTQTLAAGWMGDAEMNAACYPTIPSPVPEVAPSTPQQMTGADTWTPDQAIQATNVAQQQQTSGFFMNFDTGSTNLPGLQVPGGSGTTTPSLCSMVFGTNLAGQLGQTLCPLVMIVGGVAVIALIGLILVERR